MTNSSQGQGDLDDHEGLISKQENDLQTLRAEVGLLKSDLALRMELTSELNVQIQNLERKLHAAEEEARGAARKLNHTLEDEKGLREQVEDRNCSLLNTKYRIKALTADTNHVCPLLVVSAVRGEGDVNSAAANL